MVRCSGIQFGRQKWNTSARSSHGYSSYSGGSPPVTGLSSEDKQILFAPCAEPAKKKTLYMVDKYSYVVAVWTLMVNKSNFQQPPSFTKLVVDLIKSRTTTQADYLQVMIPHGTYGMSNAGMFFVTRPYRQPICMPLSAMILLYINKHIYRGPLTVRN